MLEFEEFPKIPRLKREIVVTEKIDGTNAQIALVELSTPELLEAAKADKNVVKFLQGASDGDNPIAIYAGSRSRWINTNQSGKGCDNFGFALWVWDHAEELRALGPGRHFGEWWGLGIQRGYGQPSKRFSLFNVARWARPEASSLPSCVGVVPVLARGEHVDPVEVLAGLRTTGSVAAPGFMNPEGVVVFHSASRQLYKLTLNDDGGKWRDPKAPSFADQLHGGDPYATKLAGSMR